MSNLHRPTGTPLIGLTLGLFTAWMWGTLPVMLKILVAWLDPWTITWFRFLVAGLLLLPLARRDLRDLAATGWRARGLLALSTIGLTGNYLTFMGSLLFISPATAQIVIQLSPVFMLLGGMIVFGERFASMQWLGLAVLVCGQGLYFHPRLDLLVNEFDREGVGVLIAVLSATLWGLYMLTQKQLLQHLRAGTILTVIYLVGSTLLIPWSEPSAVLDLPPLGVGLLVASSVMTMVSYFSFARALHHVEASRVGVLVATTPIIVMVNMTLLNAWQPQLMLAPDLPPVGMAGALLVVGGSAIAALGRRRQRQIEPAVADPAPPGTGS